MTTTARGSYAGTPEVRQRIISAATSLFASGGFRGTTMKDVALAAQMTPKGLTHHFPKKVDLLKAVLAERDKRGSVPWPVQASPFETILEIIGQNRFEPRLNELHTVVSAEATAEDHPAHQHYRDRYQRIREAVSPLFQALLDEAPPTNGATADELSVLLIAVLDGLQIQWLYEPDAIDMEALARTFLLCAVPDSLSGVPRPAAASLR